MRARLLAALAVGTLGVTALTVLPATAASSATLSVLHAIDGQNVDVYVNKKLTIDNFTPGSLAGPLTIAEGTSTVVITAPDAVDDSVALVGPIEVTAVAGQSYTLVAHQDAAGAKTATLFTNDISRTPAGQGRVTVRHVAVAPPVDVIVGGVVVVAAVPSKAEKVLTLPAGTISAIVTAAGTTTPVLAGPADVPVKEGSNTILYAWGPAPTSLSLATQTIDGLQDDPAGVNAGELGLVADPAGPPVWPFAIVGLLVVGLVGAALARRRSSDPAGRA